MKDEYICKKDAIELCNNPLSEQSMRLIPPADVVPVVRCKECKFRENDDFCTGRGFPYQLVPDDGFCDKGGRKE